MASGVHIHEPVLDTLRREDENEKSMDQASFITLSKIPLEGIIGSRHTPIEHPVTLETDFEVKDSVKGNEGRASTIEGEKFLKSPSVAEVHFEVNNLAPDVCQVTKNAEKVATEHETVASHVGEAKLDAEESNGLEKGLVSPLEVAVKSQVGHDESIPVHEAGLPENKEDSESTIPEKAAAHIESLNVNPEDTKTCVTVNDTESTSSVEEKNMASSTSPDIPGEKIEQTTFDTSQETPENISTIVPNEETEQNLSIKLDDSQMKTDENLEEENKKPESTLIPEGKIKDEESQNGLFETKNETETVIRKGEEVIEKGVESSPIAASEAEDIEASTSDQDTKASALENQILTENPQEIEVHESECKPEKETTKEQVITETTTRDASHDETTPVDKAKIEDEEPSKSDLLENKEDAESTIPVEELIVEKHLEFLNATPDNIKACDLVQDTETESSIKEKLPPATQQEIQGDKIEQTSFDTKEETPEDISKNVSNEETEQNSVVEVPFITEALRTDNKTEEKIKDENQREKDLPENNNDTETELLKQEVTEKPVESLQLASVAEDTKASTLDHETEISALENQIRTENPHENVADETESKPCDVVDTKKETLEVQDVSTIESKDDNEENLVIKEDESEKPLLRDELTRDAAGDESTYMHENKNEGEDQTKADLFENRNSAESLSLIEDNTTPKPVDSPQVDAEDVKTHVLDQDAETTGLISASEGNSNDGESAVKYEGKTEDDDKKRVPLCDNEENPKSNVQEAAQIETPIESLQETLPSTVPEGFMDDKTEEETVDAIQKDKEILDNISTIVPNEEAEQNLSIELDDSLTKTDENVGKEDEKPESTLISEGKIKNEESAQNELFETKNETETVIQKSEEVIEKGVESMPASEAEDIEASTSDHNTDTNALENQIPTEYPLEIEVDKSDCKPEKETPEEQVEDASTSASMTSEDASQTKHEAHLEKEGEKPCFTEVSTTDAGHDETTPVDKAMNEDEEPSKSDLFENKEDTEGTILVEEPILESHLESMNAIHDDIKACDLVQDTETKSSIVEKLPTATPQEIWGDKIEQTASDTKEETREDISTNVSNDETEQNSIVEVPFVTEALTTDNETEGKIKDEDQREKDLLENINDTENELLKQEVTEKPVESLQLASVAEDTKASTLDHETEISAREILTENPQEIVADETESKPCDVVDTKKETLDVQDVSTTETNDDNEENLVIKEDEREKPLLREESTRDAAGDESTYTHEDKNESEDQRRADLFENPNSAESLSLIEDSTIPRLVESPQVDAEDIKTQVLDQDAETTGLISASEGKCNDGESVVKYEVKTEDDDQKEDQLCDNEEKHESDVLLEAAHIETPIESLQETLPSRVPEGFMDDKTEEKTVDAIQKDKEILDNISTIVPNEETEQNLSIKLDDSQMKTDENLGKEDENSESTLVPEGKIKDEESTQNELFDTNNETETVIQQSEEVIETSVESSPIAASEAEDIEASTPDHDKETSALENQIPTENPKEIEVDKSESEVKYEVKTEDDDKKEDQLCDNEENSEQIETPVEALQETLPSTVPQGFLDDETEEKTVDAIHEDKEILDIQNVTKAVSNEKIEQMDGSPIQHEESLEKEHEIPSLVETTEDDSLLQGDGSQIQSKESSEEESEMTSIIEASPNNINDDNPVNVHEDSSEHEDVRKYEFGETEITSQEEEAQVKTPAKSSNIAAEDIIASDSCQETETKCSQEERTLNEEETVCEQIEAETLDAADTKTHTLEAQDVSTIVPNDNSPENSATEENDLQMKNEEAFVKETEKPSVTEASVTDASGDNSANTCEDKVEGEEQRGAELFEDKKDMESKLSKEEEIPVRLVESPQVDTEDIKTYVSDEGAEKTGTVEASEGGAGNDESAVKNEVETEDNDKKEDELSDNEKNPESGELLEAAQTEKPIESLQETLPSTVPRGFLDNDTEGKIVDALPKDEDVQNVTSTVPNEKIEENSLIQMDGSQIQHDEYLEKEHEIPLIEASTKHANDDELIVHKDNVEHEDPRKVELESEKDTEINSQGDEAQIETHIKSLQVAAKDIIAPDSYQGTETIDSQEERILNENEIVHEETEVERLDAAGTKKETPMTPDVSIFVLNDDNEENLVIGEDDSDMKNEENLGKESENPSSIEASPLDASSDESTNKCEDKIEGEEQTRAEDTECTLLKEAETAARHLESPQVDAEDIKTYVSDQGTETTGLVEVFEEVVDDNQPEVKCTIKTEDKDQKEDELCHNEKIPDSTLHLEVAETERPFESLKEALPTSVPRSFLDEKTGEKISDATEKGKETREIQNVTSIVSNENIEDDSLLQVDGSQMPCEECSEEKSERTPIIEASTKNVNDDNSINVHEDSIEHEDLRKDESFETKEDTKIISQKEEAQVETGVKSLKIAAEDIIESDSCQETETSSSQEERILNEEEIVREQIEVETLDTDDKKMETPEAQDNSTFVPNDDSEANSTTGESDLHMKDEENFGKESGKPSVIEASTVDASGDEPTNKGEDKVESEEQTGAEMFVDKKDTEEEIMEKLVEPPHIDTENIKTYVSDKGAEITGVVEAFKGVIEDDKSAVKYEVKTEDNDQKEDNLRDDEKNPESGILLEAAQVEKPIESLQETPPSTVPREFVDDKTEEKTMDAIEKDMEILDIQNVAETMSNEKIEDNSLTQADGSPIQHEEYLEKEIEIPSVIEASTKHADADELTSIHEDNIEHEDLRKVELVESNKDTDINLQKDEAQMETSPVKSLLVAAEDIIASDSYHRIETTSQEEQLLNENEIVHEQTEVERLDTADSDKETPEAQNIKENSRIPEDGSEQIHEELLEKESKTPPFSDTLTTEANDEVPEVIHQYKIEGEKLEKIDKFECDKHEEITLLDKAPAEKLNEASKEDLEDIKDIVSGANVTERSLIEVQSLNENPREIVGDHMDENIVDKDPEVREIEDELLDKDVKLANEKHTEIGFIKEEEPVEKLQEPEKKDLEEVKAFVSHEGTETSSIEERDLTEIAQESVGDLLEDKKLAKAQDIPDFTPIVSSEQTEKNSSIQPDGSQTKHEELSEKECEMLSTPETSFLHSSNNESMTIDEENLENEHSNIVDKFEDEKHTKIAIINDQAPVEEPQESSRRDNEEVKAFVSWEGAETSSAETQGLTEISPEIMGDKLEEKIIDKVVTKQEFTKFISDQNAEDISLMPVDDLQIKHEELLEKEIEASPLSETSLRNSNFNESTILHQDKIEDELLNRVDKFESEKHAEISLIKEEAPLEKLNDSPLRKDLEEIKAFDSSEDKETSSTGERNLTAVPQENDFTTVDASQIRHEELLERESEAPPLPLLHSSDGKSAIVHTDKIEDEELEKVDKFEGIESGEATLLNEEASAEKLTESSEDREGIKESITCDGTEITSSTEKHNLTTISQETVDDQEEEKVLNIAGETSDCTTVIPDNNNTERNLSVEVDASQMKHEEHLEEESRMPSLSLSNTSTEEPTIVHENKIMEHAEIILSNEEAFENSSKEENENVRASVLCEDTETSSLEQENLKENSREIVGDQVKDEITDIAQNAPDLTTITSDENSKEGSLIPLDGSQIKHEEPLEKESGTPSMSILDTTIEDSTIPQGHVTDDQDPRKVDELEHEKDTEASLLKEPTPAEKVTESAKDDLEDTKVFLSCEDKEITSSVEEQSQKANQQEIVVDQTQGNVIDSATEALDFIETVSRENAGENSLIQAEESNVKHEIVSDQTKDNVLETAPKEQDFKPVISHDNAEENSLIQVDESQMKHDELEKESETPSLLILDTSNEESKTIYEDKNEVENLKKVLDFECGKREQITSTEEETQVAKVNESLKEDLEDIKALVSGEDSETTSFEEKQGSKENPREILSDQQEEKILDIAPEAQNLIKVVSSENVEKDSIIQEDGSPTVHEEITEKEGETPSLSAALTLDTTIEDSTVMHENKIENEDTREVDTFECEKHVDGEIPDAAPETLESKIIVLDENTEEKSLNQVDESQTKHKELLGEESKTVSLSEISLLNTNNEDSTTVGDNKIENEDPEKVDKLESEKHKEFPLTKEEEPGQVVNNPLQEDNKEIKEFVSCLDTETTSSTEDQSVQINPQEVMENQMEENIIDTTPEPQNLTTLVSDENTKDDLSLDDDESPIKHEELLENESEKPFLSIPKTSNEEPSFICGSKTENEDVKRDEKVEQLNDFPEGPEIIEVSVPNENLETTIPIEERSLTENPQKNTKDKLVGVVPEALESKTIVSDKNIEETSFILEDGSQMKHEENVEKESEMPSVSENSILNTRNEEPTHFLDEKIEDEDQAKVNKSECEKHAEITEVPMENLNSSNLESTEAFVSSEDIEPKNSTEEQSLTVNPIENMDGQTVDKVLDKALEAPDFRPVVPDDNNDDIPSIQVDGSQMKHEEPLEKESNVLSSLETSLANPNNEEMETIHKDEIEDEALENVDEFESKKCSEIKFKEEAQVEESTVYKDIKEYDSYEDTEASARQEQILAANPQDILSNQSEDNVIDAADSKEKITENLPVSNENVVKDSLIHIDESEIKHEENLEKEPYLEETSTVAANNESSTSHEDVIEEESGKIVESTLLNEGSPAYEADESLQVVSEDIKAPVSCQKTDTISSSINADPQEIAGDQTDDKINTDGTREITLEAVNLTTLNSNENEVLDSITPQDGLEIEHKETSMLADREEPIIVHEDTIEGEDLKKVDTFESAPQTKNTLLKEKAHEDEYVDSLQVASEPVKASISCQDRDTTSSFEEQILTTTPQIVSDQVEEKLDDTAKTREETPASSSVLAFQEDEANRIGVDDINSVMIEDEVTVNRSNAAENDDICSSDKVQAKEEEMEIISKTEIDEEAGKDDTWIKLTDDEINETSMEEKEIDFSSRDKDTSEITKHDGAEDIPKGNENSRDKNEFLEDGYSYGSTESTTPIVNEDAEKIDKDIKAETVITETGAASSGLPITGVQCGPEETAIEDSKAKETETSSAAEDREYQGQHTKLHKSPPPLSHVKDSESEMAQEQGRDNLQSGDDTNDDIKELDEGSVAVSNEGNFLETNLNEKIETEVTPGEKEASAVQRDLVSDFVVQEIQEQAGKTVEAVPEEKGIKGEQGEIKFDDSDDLKINSSTMVTDKVAPSDILCSSTSDAGQRAVGQETQIVVQEKEQKPGEGKAIEAVPEEKGINTEEDEIKEHDFNVLKENSRTEALDKVTPVNILQGSTTAEVLRATDEETPEQHGLDEASLKETEGGSVSTTDKLTVIGADQIGDANFDGSVASNKTPVLQHGDSSESLQTEGEKQKTSEPEKGEKCGNEVTAKLTEISESTEMDKPSLSGLIQEPVKEVLKVVDHSIDKKEPTTKEEELQAEKSDEVEQVEAKTDEEKDGEEESCEHQISDLSSDAPVMVDATDRDVKVTPKKSHNILSGVGSKVKHSISKVRKAITGKSSQPKSASPKYSEKI
ncbi:uncharacterized protein [Henckelia pumila]|uniref:uncharacterized protein isoform X2 n=1 Tax=Henckelia pumila TaxID=405737 RepID=UPI003C6E7F59